MVCHRLLLRITLLIGLLIGAAPSAPAQDHAAHPISQKAIDAAIDRGAAYLIAQQDIDGSWRFDIAKHVGGMTGFAVYTLIKAGVSPEHHAVQRGLLFLDTLQAKSTYEAACMILAYGSVDPKRYASRLQDLTDQLIDWQEGAWAYPEGAQDISNTHFGALGLRAANQFGCNVPIKVWESLARSMLRWQSKDGAFLYHAGRDATLSMTAAGVGIVCVAKEQLASQGEHKQPHRMLRQLDQAIQEGLAWMETRDPIPHGEWKGNAPHRRWDYYYLYGLQRVGVLLAEVTLAGKPWYQDGARWLLQKQGNQGQWATAYGEAQPNTCLAILFLRRASAPLTGEKPSHLYVVKVEDPEADVQIIASGQNPTRVWIRSIHPLIYDSWEWPEETGQGLRIRRVEYWSGETLLATVPGNGESPIKDAPFATEIQFEGLRVHPLRARVYVAPPPGDPEADPFVESPDISVEYARGLEPWQVTYGSARSRNLLLQTKVRVETSSQRNATWKAAHGADGLQGTGWVCAKEDPTPQITLHLKKAQGANRIWLSHAVDNPSELGAFARARKVSVTVNRRKPMVVDLSGDGSRKEAIDLPRKERIRRLEIQILEREAGSKHGLAAGFMEIELELAER